MIRPCRFGYNPQTAVTNAFQSRQAPENEQQAQALREFDNYAELLDKHGIEVLVVDDTPEPRTPDSIFPNNWISFHGDAAILYPMCAPNRRIERKAAVFAAIARHYPRSVWYDYTANETCGRFLEGTGSIVYDRYNALAYACRSPRTDESLLDEVCRRLHYKKLCFDAVDPCGRAIYHTNVMMSVARDYAVICLQSIPEDKERRQVIKTLKKTGKYILEISPEQLNRFAGNMFQVFDKKRQPYLVMSAQAKRSLDAAQIARMESFNPILSPALDTIEIHGGGSARCMLAAIY